MCDVALSTGCARRAIELAVWSTSAARGVQLVGKGGLIADVDSMQPLEWQATVSSTPDRPSDPRYSYAGASCCISRGTRRYQFSHG